MHIMTATVAVLGSNTMHHLLVEKFSPFVVTTTTFFGTNECK